VSIFVPVRETTEHETACRHAATVPVASDRRVHYASRGRSFPLTALAMLCIPRLPLVPCALLLVAACAPEGEPALSVDGLHFYDGEVAPLDEREMASLADLAALAAAVRDDALPEVGEPLIEREVHRARLEVLGRALAAREMGLDDAELRAAYEADPDWELEVAHVIRLVEPGDTPGEREEARLVAAEVQRRAAAGEDFAALAAEYSEEPRAAERGGRLQPGREGSWVPEFWEAAVELEPGEVSGVVESPFGYHVIRLEDRRPVPFEEADPAGVLERAVPPAAAAEAMGAWAAEQAGRLALDVPAIMAAREIVLAGEAPDTLVLARWSGGEYTARDLALYRIAVDESGRRRLDEADDARFGQMVEEEATQAMWADAAEAEGVQPPATVRREAARGWVGRVGRLAASVELHMEMPAEARRDRVLELARSGRAEARAARGELRVLRPLLRERYPVRTRGEEGRRSADPV
jgi:hypothetical protein